MYPFDEWNAPHAHTHTRTRVHTIKSVKQTNRLTLPSKRRYIHINTHELCEKTRLQCLIHLPISFDSAIEQKEQVHSHPQKQIE